MKPVATIIFGVTLYACTSSAPAVVDDAGPDAGMDGGTDASVDGGEAGRGGSAGSGGSGGAGGDPGPTERRVFVTNTIQTGSMSGIAGADAICAMQAGAAGLDGEFKAWLSTLASPVSDRFVRSTVPYVLVDGTVIADDWNDLTNGDIQAPIDLDATGQVRGGDVWTGTLPSGESYEDGDCEEFESSANDIRSLCGSTQFSDTRWSAAQTPTCNARLRLFCIEQ